MLVFVNCLLWTVVLVLSLFNRSVMTGNTPYDTLYACDGKMLKIECKEGYMINLIRANYGRFSITVCNDHGSTDWSVNCMTHKSLNLLQTRCHQKRNCSIQASTSLFGDPCPGTVKYLEAHYMCISVTSAPSTARPAPPWLMTSQPSVWSTAKSLTLLPDIAAPTSSSVPSTTKVLIPSTDQQVEKEEDSNWPSNTVPPSAQITSESENVAFRTTTEPHLTSTEGIWMFTDDKLPLCKPTNVRNLSWNWTYGGEVSVQPCPGGATGLAQWRCQAINKHIAIRFPDTPDLSDCRSVWLTSLENRITDGDTITKIASDLSQVTESKTLYGGDVMTTCKLIRDMVQKMSKDVLTFPDPRQREAVVQDLLQSVVQIGSNLLDISLLPSWQDLAYSDQMRIATSLLVGLEENSFLFASTASREKTVTHCERNIVLRVQVMEVRNVGDATFSVSLADKCPIKTNNYVQLQKSSLLDNSDLGMVRVLYIAFDSLDNILKTQSPGKDKRRINSKVLSASLGKGRHIQLNVPVTLCFEHLQTENVTNPSCVFWDYTQNMWSEEGCMLVSTNITHTICQCNHLTNFAILVDIKPLNFASDGFSLYFFISVIFIITLVGIIIFVFYRCVKNQNRKEYGSFVEDNIWISKCFRCCTSSADSEKTLKVKDERPALYGNAASQSIPIDTEDITIQPTHNIPHTSNTIPRSFITENSIENHYPPHPKLNHNYSTYGRNGSIRKIKEARRLEHIENALQHRNRKLSGTLGSNSPRSHTYSEIVTGSTRSDPVYEEIEREKEHCSQVSDISDEDGKRHSDMSRQSSKSYGDHRPLIPYNAVQDRNFHAALDAAFKQQLKEQNARTVSVLDGQTVVCHLQQPDSRMYNKPLGHSPHHY